MISSIVRSPFGALVPTLLLALALAITLTAAGAQSPCPRCEIRLVEVGTFGKESDSAHFNSGAVPYLLSDGKVIVHSVIASGLFEFSRNGALLSARGAPLPNTADLAGVRRISIAPGDTIYAARPPLLDVLTTDARGYVRRMNFSAGTFGAIFIVLRSGEVVLQTSKDDSGSFLHAMRTDGQLRRSFGAVRLGPVECGPTCRLRLFSQAQAANEFFAVSPTKYTIERWTTNGDLRQEIDVAATWFSNPLKAAVGMDPPPPRLSSVAYDSSASLIWVSGQTHNDKWTRDPCVAAVAIVGGRGVALANRADAAACPPAAGAGGSVAGMVLTGTPLPTDMSGFTSVIDAIDPGSGAFLASKKFDGEIIYGLPNGHAFTRRQRPSGNWSIVIWRLELVRPPTMRRPGDQQP